MLIKIRDHYYLPVMCLYLKPRDLVNTT